MPEKARRSFFAADEIAVRFSLDGFIASIEGLRIVEQAE